jgi:rare lipoprotein A
MQQVNKRTSLRLILIVVITPLLASCGIVHPVFDRDDSGGSASPAPEGSEEVFEIGSVIQEGVASWYGPDFQGRLTANGEVYEMNDFTAAHRTLPFNTVIRVTNLENQQSVDVRINDRGPYVGERIIDLSRAAAEEIDMVQAGLVPVELELIEIGDRDVTRGTASSRENFTVQLASHANRRDAERESEAISGSEVVDVQIGGETIYRVYYGNYQNAEDAERQLRRLRRQGHNGFVKQREN